MKHPTTPTLERSASAWAIYRIFLRLGLSSFGGPVAHLAYFRTEFVLQRRWLSDAQYAELVALCQFLPGPASSQVGFALGLQQGGWRGACAAWLGFTLPSALLLVLFALLLQHGAGTDGGWLGAFLHGLVLAALAVVAQALWGMGRSLCPDWPRRALALLGAGAVLVWPSPWTLVGVIALGALAGRTLLARPVAQGEVATGASADAAAEAARPAPLSLRSAWVCLALFAAGLLLLPLWAAWSANPSVAMVEAFYRSGALVFGGGHVVMPMLQAEVVAPGWVDLDTFLAGYAAAQAVPGPLFTFAAFLGASMSAGPVGGWLGAALALLAVFAPGLLLLAAALPHWQRLRQNAALQRALLGVNAAVVGLLLAALLQPLLAGVVGSVADAALLALAALALLGLKRPAWQVVLGCGLLALALAWGMGQVQA